MSAVEIRRFARADRDQVTALVNAHIAAVVPGLSVSVQTMMSQLEREPGEFIVDPWVRDRLTFVAVQRHRVVAAAYLLRYGSDDEVSESYRDTGEIRWLLCWPPASFWPDARTAGDALASACVARLRDWGVARCYADGTLPVPGVYGVPEQWPHIRDIYRGVGFAEPTRTECVYLARVADLPQPVAPVDDVVAVRSVGVNGTRISAAVDGEVVGYIEVDTNLDGGPRTSRTTGWADIGNLYVVDAHRGKGVGTWLVALAAEWLELGHVTRLLGYADSDDEPGAEFLRAKGFRLLTRTVRGLRPVG